jgi:hypothetical protein
VTTLSTVVRRRGSGVPGTVGGRPRDGALRLLLRGPGGVVRVLAVVSIGVALVARGPVDAALFTLVLAGLVVPVAARIGLRLDVAYGTGLLAAAWAGALDLYEAVPWLDVVMHLVVTGLIAAVAHLALARWTGAVAEPGAATGRAGAAGVVAVTTAIGLALSVYWEVGEYLGHTYADSSIHVAYRDTIGDMVMGGIGSTVAGAALVLRGRRFSPGA